MSEPNDELNYTQVTGDYAVTGQIDPAQIPQIKAAGFKGLICNRPDGEAPEEPQFDAVGTAAREAGLEVRYIPVSNQVGLTPENVADMRKALAEMDGPVLAYCRTGGRSRKLFEAAGG